MATNDPKFEKLVDQVDLFAGLTPQDVRKIFSRGMTIRVEKGETVFFKGTTGDQMYVILGGQVGVFDGPKRVATLGVGSTFGEMSLLNNEPRSATIVAMEACSLFVLSENIFKKLLTKRVAVQILLNIGRTMSSRVKDSNLNLRESEGR